MAEREEYTDSFAAARFKPETPLSEESEDSIFFTGHRRNVRVAHSEDDDNDGVVAPAIGVLQRNHNSDIKSISLNDRRITSATTATSSTSSVASSSTNSGIPIQSSQHHEHYLPRSIMSMKPNNSSNDSNGVNPLILHSRRPIRNHHRQQQNERVRTGIRRFRSASELTTTRVPVRELRLERLRSLPERNGVGGGASGSFRTHSVPRALNAQSEVSSVQSMTSHSSRDINTTATGTIGTASARAAKLNASAQSRKRSFGTPSIASSQSFSRELPPPPPPTSTMLLDNGIMHSRALVAANESARMSSETKPKLTSSASTINSSSRMENNVVNKRQGDDGQLSDDCESNFNANSSEDDALLASSEFKLKYTDVHVPVTGFLEHYRLRALEMKRPIRVMAVVTMYNENADELASTFKGIARNLQTFIDELGPDAWKEFLVVLVADGRIKADSSALEYLQNEMDLYNATMVHNALDAVVVGEEMLKQSLIENEQPDNEAGVILHAQPVHVHMFERTVIVPSSVVGSEFPPMQIVFALKERNGGKLDSHYWFFKAFAEQLQPSYCFTIDVGTKPMRDAMWKLYAAMEREPQCAGCAGEIAPRIQASVVPYVAAQQFEYKIATVLDKSMESVFGFISVLPGAFSAYRFEALRGAPLTKYFSQLHFELRHLSPFKGNMYLAEDRILCFELLAEKDCRWVLRYVKGALALTDVPQTLTDLIKQRRRWLNGSLFAMVYAIKHFGEFFLRSRHSMPRKLFVAVQFAYFAFQLILTWFLLANLFLMFKFSSQGLGSEADFFNGIFMVATLVQVVIGLGNKPDEMHLVYTMCSVSYGVFFMYTLMLNAKMLLFERVDSQAALAALGAVGVYVAAALLHGEIFPILVSIIQYFFMLPTFLVGFPIYSFCNVHDISWGTKGLESSELIATSKDSRVAQETKAQKKREMMADLDRADARFRTFRSHLVIAWLSTNMFFVVFVVSEWVTTYYIDWVYYVFFAFNAFKFFFCFIYILAEYTRRCVEKPTRNKHAKGLDGDKKSIAGAKHAKLVARERRRLNRQKQHCIDLENIEKKDEMSHQLTDDLVHSPDISSPMEAHRSHALQSSLHEVKIG